MSANELEEFIAKLNIDLDMRLTLDDMLTIEKLDFDSIWSAIDSKDNPKSDQIDDKDDDIKRAGNSYHNINFMLYR